MSFIGSISPTGDSPDLGVIHHLEVIGTGAIYIVTGNSPKLGGNHHLEVIRTVAIYIQAGNSPNLGVYHHLEVIRTGATYIPAGNLPNFCLSHHLEVIGTWATCIPVGNSPNFGVSHHLEVIGNIHLPLGGSASSPPNICWYQFYTSVQQSCNLLRHCPMSLPSQGMSSGTFAGTNFTPWSSEAVIY